MRDIKVRLMSSEADTELFWRMYDVYIQELADNATQGDGIDLTYFGTEEYKSDVERIRLREKNPVKIYFISNDDIILGFSMYQLLFDETKNCCLMEYYIAESFRNEGLGKTALNLVEGYMKADGVETVELTPTNENNRGFWEDNGYKLTDQVDDDNKSIFIKEL